MAGAPTRSVPLGSAEVTVTRQEDGVMHLRSLHPLGAYPRCLTELLVYWAKAAPDRRFLAQRRHSDLRAFRHGDGAWRRRTHSRQGRTCADEIVLQRR